MSRPPIASERAASSTRGFTLVEVICVIMVIGLLAAIAIPRIDIGRPRVDTAAMEVGSHLLLAQRVAVMRQHDVRVVMDPDEGTLLIHRDANNDGDVDTGEGIEQKQIGEGVVFGVGTAPLRGSGEAITFADGSESLPTLTYHRNGSASEEGVIHITTTGESQAMDDRAVRVERATGLSTCWTRRTGSWEEGC